LKPIHILVQHPINISFIDVDFNLILIFYQLKMLMLYIVQTTDLTFVGKI
jgi:hypothetical protein